MSQVVQMVGVQNKVIWLHAKSDKNAPPAQDWMRSKRVRGAIQRLARLEVL